MKRCQTAILAILIAAAFHCFSQSAHGENLTPTQIVRLHRLIKPTEAESQFLSIPWMTSIHAARQKAAREGKPLMIFMIHGHLLAGC